MAIVIPSKHIYSKSFDPVVDNSIDKVEVSANEVVPDNHYDETVYNEDFDVSSYTSGILQIDYKYEYRNIMNLNQYHYACAYVNMVPYYCIHSVTIPKIKDTKSIISSVLGGFDKDNNANIKYSTVCEVLNGTVSAKLDIYDSDKSGKKLKDLVVNYPQPTNDYQLVNIPTKLSKNETYSSSAGDNFNVTAELVLNNETNLGTLTISEDNDNYYFTCKLLCGAEIYEISGKGYIDGNALAFNFPMSGTATKYIPHSITITVYGNTIGIDLQDKTITIGDGNNVFSFDGNEIIQTTNEYLISKQIILKKETSSPSMQIPYFIIQNNVDVKVGDKIQYENQTFTISHVSSNNAILLNSLTFGSDFSNGAIINATALLIDNIEENYNKITNEWKTGKQTAVITCPIADYYGIAIKERPINSLPLYKDTIITFKENFNQTTLYSSLTNSFVLNYGSQNSPQLVALKYIRMPMKAETLVDGKIRNFEYLITDGTQLGATNELYAYGTPLETTDIYVISPQFTLTKNFTTDNQQFYQWLVDNAIKTSGELDKVISIGGENNLPMIFNIGDIVIPYTYTNQGDKPLSYNKDFKPKRFKVVGAGISKKQGGMQELTLQEV